MATKKRFKMTARLWQFAGLAALAIVTLAVVAYALIPSTPAPDSAPSATPVVKETVAPKPKAVFLGDSYTQGTGASSPATKWAQIVSDSKGFRGVNLGRGGTGYVNTAAMSGCGLSYCPSFLEMVRDAVAEKPSVVFVSGGQNDLTRFQSDPKSITDAISKTFSQLRAGLPDAKIIAVGPSTPGTVGAAVVEMDSAVQQAAKAANATYVSLLDPNVIAPAMLAEDKVHVNDTGHKAIAERVISALG